MAEDTSTLLPAVDACPLGEYLSNPTSHRGILSSTRGGAGPDAPSQCDSCFHRSCRGGLAALAAAYRIHSPPIGCAVLGIGAFTGILAQLPTFYDGQVMPGGTFFLPFALISVISAVQMITTSRPVYAALHFVLVVLASSGLLVTLGAEFLGFAVVIVYAGAILITYMFVLMLAQQAQSPDLEDERPTYDRFAREPIGGPWLPFCSWRS